MAEAACSQVSCVFMWWWRVCDDAVTMGRGRTNSDADEDYTPVSRVTSTSDIDGISRPAKFHANLDAPTVRLECRSRLA